LVQAARLSAVLTKRTRRDDAFNAIEEGFVS
jgi:hypothetical protein